MTLLRGIHVVAVALALAPELALAHEHEGAHAGAEKFGGVHFPTSCTAGVKPAFERGLAMLHSFAYAQAAEVFQDVAAKDPRCGIAQWGVAMTYFHVIWGPPTDDEFVAGRAAAVVAEYPSARSGSDGATFSSAG